MLSTFFQHLDGNDAVLFHMGAASDCEGTPFRVWLRQYHFLRIPTMSRHHYATYNKTPFSLIDFWNAEFSEAFSNADFRLTAMSKVKSVSVKPLLIL